MPELSLNPESGTTKWFISVIYNLCSSLNPGEFVVTVVSSSFLTKYFI